MTITSARPRVRATRTALLVLPVLPGLVWAAIRLFGAERGHLVPLFAFTPYAAALAWVPAVPAIAARRRLVTAVALAPAAVLAGCVLPRAVPDADRGPAHGVRLTVMTINMYVGAADPAAIVRLVREHDVAVLAVQEFTPRAMDGLTAAGLDPLLPYHALAEEPGTTGSGLYSRFPVSRPGSQRGRGGNLQAYAIIEPPGAKPLAVRSAHPIAPYATSVLADWRADLDAEPAAGAGPPRILLGDFNSTLDHAPVRRLIARGYRDAADAAGKGLLPTWGPYAGRPIPPVTIDHVLADKRVGVGDVEVAGVRGSDHRSIIATLLAPAA